VPVLSRPATSFPHPNAKTSPCRACARGLKISSRGNVVLLTNLMSLQQPAAVCKPS
jgi:hypothetical protein